MSVYSFMSLFAKDYIYVSDDGLYAKGGQLAMDIGTLRSGREFDFIWISMGQDKHVQFTIHTSDEQITVTYDFSDILASQQPIKQQKLV